MSLPTLPIPNSRSSVVNNSTIGKCLTWQQTCSQRQTHRLTTSFPGGIRDLIADFQAIFQRDPAAGNWLEVLLCYPGLHALAGYRLTHWLHYRGVFLLPRLISHIVRWFTGIEIHPGAQIGRGVVIDHGMGVVIGETTIVGDYALIYQGVTLGGTGKETGKRHPTLGCNVVVGAGAKVLGNIQIGDYARIGAGTIVLKDVPAYCTAVGVPSRNLCQSNKGSAPLEGVSTQQLRQRIAQLENEVKQLKRYSYFETN